MDDLEKQKVENYNKYYSDRKFIAYSPRFSKNIDAYLILPDDKLRPISKEEVYLHNEKAIKYVVKPNTDDLKGVEYLRLLKKEYLGSLIKQANVCNKIIGVNKDEIILSRMPFPIIKADIRDGFEEVFLYIIKEDTTLQIGNEIVYNKFKTNFIDFTDDKSYKIIGIDTNNILLKNDSGSDVYIDKNTIKTEFLLLKTKYQIVNAYTDTDKKDMKSILLKRDIQLNDYIRPIDNSLFKQYNPKQDYLYVKSSVYKVISINDYGIKVDNLDSMINTSALYLFDKISSTSIHFPNQLKVGDEIFYTGTLNIRFLPNKIYTIKGFDKDKVILKRDLDTDAEVDIQFVMKYFRLILPQEKDKETMEKNTKEKKPNKELVNHPAHYNQSIECIDAMIAAKGWWKVAAFCELNDFKYNWRQGKKDDLIQEMSKQEWYISKCKDLWIKALKYFNKKSQKKYAKVMEVKMKDPSSREWLKAWLYTDGKEYFVRDASECESRLEIIEENNINE